MEQVTETLHNHYRETFLLHGATSKGVDWGEKEWASLLRQAKMLEVINNTGENNISLLDVGCGYGALADIIKKQALPIDYTGIEVVKEMLEVAKTNHPNHQFIHGDILEVEVGKYDYVVCNGILTQKLDTSILEMNQFAQRLIRKLFEICNCGVAFNLMTTFVNFQSDNLYYRNPAELMAWCMSELTPHIRVDCAYQLWYEYTVYLYKKPN
ncbi:MAG: class I SAM-dependent methyltransferase [Pseudanabaenaceae cyanobacterium bins.39]|nr:class I SAM-dependent methyltransferase [Pseudanabaenaceae cyanobacterium bins.39]